MIRLDEDGPRLRGHYTGPALGMGESLWETGQRVRS